MFLGIESMAFLMERCLCSVNGFCDLREILKDINEEEKAVVVAAWYWVLLVGGTNQFFFFFSNTMS